MRFQNIVKERLFAKSDGVFFAVSIAFIFASFFTSSFFLDFLAFLFAAAIVFYFFLSLRPKYHRIEANLKDELIREYNILFTEHQVETLLQSESSSPWYLWVFNKPEDVTYSNIIRTFTKNNGKTVIDVWRLRVDGIENVVLEKQGRGNKFSEVKKVSSVQTTEPKTSPKTSDESQYEKEVKSPEETKK